MSYAHDLLTLRYGRINDGVLRFSRRHGASAHDNGIGADRTRRVG